MGRAIYAAMALLGVDDAIYRAQRRGRVLVADAGVSVREAVAKWWRCRPRRLELLEGHEDGCEADCESYSAFVAGCVRDCSCCSSCADVPCAGVTAGGVCDRMCSCDDECDDGDPASWRGDDLDGWDGVF